MQSIVCRAIAVRLETQASVVVIPMRLKISDVYWKLFGHKNFDSIATDSGI